MYFVDICYIRIDCISMDASFLLSLRTKGIDSCHCFRSARGLI